MNKNNMDRQKINIITGSVVAVVIILIFGFFMTKGVFAPVSSIKYDDFAKCTASKDLTMYGAVWCSHCQDQKKLFGDSFKYVKYIECPDNIKLCIDLGIDGYPTWMDGSGKKYEGLQSLENIAKITGCELPQ
jgi:hypothetical protein